LVLTGKAPERYLVLAYRGPRPGSCDRSPEWVLERTSNAPGVTAQVEISQPWLGPWPGPGEVLCLWLGEGRGQGAV